MGSEGNDTPKSSSIGSGASEEPVFLHGDLELWILEAKSLPNMDLISERMRKCCNMIGQSRFPFMKRPGLSSKHSMITSDPYVSVCLSGATIAQTRVIANCENPLWDEHFCVPVAHSVAKLEFHVKDNDVLGAELIGVVEIPVENILSGNEINDWFPIKGSYGKHHKPSPQLHLTVHYRPIEQIPLYKDGVGAGPHYEGVPKTYFPLRKEGNVTLYQDAHVPPGMLPEISLDGGKVFCHGQCWEEICHAVLEARHLIYIIGWSVFHPVKLVREPTKPLPSGGELSLGELLKRKSEEGVRVLLLIWDDKTSHNNAFIKMGGVMRTHDEETRKFFKRSSVHCVLAPRYACSKLSIFKQQVVGTLFTHHQKCVLVDTPASENNRKITAFIGGIDLCDGRYDTPEHRIFNDLDTVYANDFHNPTFQSHAKGPREPWHDMHCKVEGPAAYDILINFEQRWRRASKWREFSIKSVGHWNDDTLINLDRVGITPSTGPHCYKPPRAGSEKETENWHVQVFRSIDSGSVRGFPKDVEEAVAQNLVCGKDLKVDKSIHSAYIKAIRSAQHFIYIENQYFIGSSYHWSSHKGAGADNLVPMELALKIISKINAGERFSVYVVIPMWPEGIPNSAAVQEILYWQGQTMSMMYKIVAQALQENSLSDKYHPQDYLNFYCLGKREARPLERSQMNRHAENRALAAVQKFRRFMIYVHAKGMIVDDEYVIMGSANINQRSLEGSRDTEIAIGAYQPHHTWAAKKSHPRGQVYGYRTSLWAEHLANLEVIFREPQSLECMQCVNEIAGNNWKAFVSDNYKEMRGHLMQYPVQISREGKVSTLRGYETFPDVGGKILGSHSNLPNALTT